jgi:hypothetical protein
MAQLARALRIEPVPRTGLALLPAETGLNFNSMYPRDWNDGALWNGAGFSLALRAGAHGGWRHFEVGIAPVLALHQNEAFSTHFHPNPDLSRWAHRWHGRGIDLPQRFGADPFAAVDAGQSFVRAAIGGLRVGASTENVAWGPARRNPLLLSGTSAGFPHLFVETGGGRDIGIGRAELQLFFGRLHESGYFDRDPTNDQRAIAGTIVTLAPDGVPGLYLGAGRLHTQRREPASMADILIGPFFGIDPDSAGLPRDMRLYSLFMRWVVPGSGFEVYGEWARQNSWREWFSLQDELEGHQAYTIGVQKAGMIGTRAWRLSAEISHLADTRTHLDAGRGTSSFYVDAYVTQGHTHRGQLLGAPIGPGSEAQFIGFDLFWSRGRSTVSIERVRYDDDTYYAVYSQVHGPHGHDTELTVRGGHVLTARRLAFEAELGYSMRYSRHMLGLLNYNFADYPYKREDNLGLRATARWVPRWTWSR